MCVTCSTVEEKGSHVVGSLPRGIYNTMGSELGGVSLFSLFYHVPLSARLIAKIMHNLVWIE